jgi:copper chaperone NosL
MTIVDKQHAAELVTRKGKVFKFDATECMMNHLAKGDMETIALFLVNDYNNPGTLIDATKATYLISENIPSPLGAYLSAFRNIEMAELASSAEKDMLMNWGELQEKYWQ